MASTVSSQQVFGSGPPMVASSMYVPCTILRVDRARLVFIIPWNVAGAFPNPNAILANLNSPSCVTNPA